MSSNLPISSKYRSTPDAPVDDAERSDLTQRLNDAYADGTIDVDDYRRYMDQLFAAQHLGELVPVVENLPAHTTYHQPGNIETGSYAPGEVSQAASAHRFTIAMTLAVGGLAVVALVLLLILL